MFQLQKQATKNNSESYSADDKSQDTVLFIGNASKEC